MQYTGTVSTEEAVQKYLSCQALLSQHSSLADVLLNSLLQNLMATALHYSILLLLIAGGNCKFAVPRLCRVFCREIGSLALITTLVCIPDQFVNRFVAFAAEDVTVLQTVSVEQPKVILNEYRKSKSTGIEFYDYKIGEGPAAKFGDKVAYNYKGRLAGT